MLLIIWGIVVSAVIGAAVTFAAPRVGGPQYRVTGLEFVAALLLSSLIVVPAITWGGTKLALSNNLSYDEWWNGWETAAEKDATPCSRDGNCHWTYQCDSYQEWVSDTKTVSDGNGGTTTVDDSHWETRWHHCPHASVEYRYTIETTLGDFEIAEHRLPADAATHPWRASEPTPAEVLDDAGVGDPPEWAAARARLDAGDPGPVTVSKSYDNYILASQNSTLRKLSTDIARYDKAGLIPDPPADPVGWYRANKTHLIGVRANASEWSDAVDRLSSALGSERRGDLHFVAVDASKVADPATYAAALMASWTSPERGAKGLAKNAVVVIVGVKDGKVSWAQFDTGMPIGNEDLAVAVRDELPGTPFTVKALLGHATVAAKGKVDPGSGAVAKLLFAKGGGFVRACMVCDDADDVGLGFSYLSSEITPTGGQTVLIILVGALLSTAIWVAFAIATVGPQPTSDGGDGAGGTGPRYRYVGRQRYPSLPTSRPWPGARPRPW